MTVAEYEQVRQQDDRFALLPATRRKSSKPCFGERTGTSSSTRSRKRSRLLKTTLAPRPRNSDADHPSTTDSARRASSSASSSLGCSGGRGNSLR